MLDLPSSAKQVRDRIKADIRSALPIANPFVTAEWLGTLADAFAERVYSFYHSITQLISELFPDTTTLYVERWASLYNLSRKSGVGSTGTWYYTGSISPGTGQVPNGSLLTDSDGNSYEVLTSSGLRITIAQAATWTRSGDIFTITFADHFLPSGADCTFSFSNYGLLDGVKQVTTTGVNTFTVIAPLSGTVPASGSCLVSFNSQQTTVRAISTGLSTNLAEFSQLSLSAGILGITSLGMAGPLGFTGGLDQETVSALRDRLLNRLRNPIANFNVAQIETTALQVSSITRVVVKEITPAVGQVTVYPLVDGSNPPIPSTVKIEEVKNELLKIKPADISDNDLFVSQATTTSVNITLTVLAPNTSNMKTSITGNLKQLFETQASVGVTLTLDDIRSAINSTIDTSTGESVTSFTMTVPAADVVPSSNALPILGTTTYPV